MVRHAGLFNSGLKITENFGSKRRPTELGHIERIEWRRESQTFGVLFKIPRDPHHAHLLDTRADPARPYGSTESPKATLVVEPLDSLKERVCFVPIK